MEIGLDFGEPWIDGGVGWFGLEAGVMQAGAERRFALQVPKESGLLWILVFMGMTSAEDMHYRFGFTLEFIPSKDGTGMTFPFLRVFHPASIKRRNEDEFAISNCGKCGTDDPFSNTTYLGTIFRLMQANSDSGVLSQPQRFSLQLSFGAVPKESGLLWILVFMGMTSAEDMH